MKTFHDLSIIIPLGKTDIYLIELLQTFLDSDIPIKYEIILILDLCANYEIEKKLGKYLNQIKITRNNSKNKGPGICRNIGLSIANGKFILFIDSDDLIELNKLVELVSDEEINYSDIVEYNYCLIGEKNIENVRENEFSKYYKNDSDLAFHLLKGEIRDECIFQLYSKDFLLKNHLGFPSGIYEDIEFRYQTLLRAKNVISKNISIYKKRVHKNNITSNNKKIANLNEYYAKLYILSKKISNKNHLEALRYRVVAFAGLLAGQALKNKKGISRKTELQLFQLIFLDWNLEYIRFKNQGLTKRERIIKEYLESLN